MLFLFGSGKDYERKEGGKTLFRLCPHFGVRRQFHEVVPVEYVHVFFIPVLKDKPSAGKSPVYECEVCDLKYSFIGPDFQSVFGAVKDKLKGSKVTAAYREKKNAASIDKELQRLKKQAESENH